MLPNIIETNGVYLYADDYFHQQIPFYIHATDTVNNLGIGWDWYTDLGTDFLSSYRSKKRFQQYAGIIAWDVCWFKNQEINGDAYWRNVKMSGKRMMILFAVLLLPNCRENGILIVIYIQK